MSDDAPKIQIDSDWKAEAQREKEKLAEQAKARQEADAQAKASAAGPAAAPGSAAAGAQAQAREIPPANFETLMTQLATQALMAMGGMADPRTGQPMLQLDLARYHIDMLAVLEEKTEGNLSDEEKQSIATTLYELCGRYVQVANAARQKG